MLHICAVNINMNMYFLHLYHLPQLIQRSSHLPAGVAPHNLTCITHSQKDIHSACIWQYESTMTHDGSGFYSCPRYLHKTIGTWKGKWTGVRAARRFPNLITSIIYMCEKPMALCGKKLAENMAGAVPAPASTLQAWLLVRDVLPSCLALEGYNNQEPSHCCD